MSEQPAKRHLPYGRQSIDEEDIAAVVEVLRSDWLTTGPKVGELERALATFTKASDAVAVSSGTAALHAAMFALGVGPGDEVVVPAMTFAASANAAAYMGATPVFADVDASTLLIDPASVARKISPKTKAIVAVDYAGQPCDYDALRAVTGALPIVADACHALGGSDKEREVGSIATLSCFSFHPVKHITTGEGGAITTNDPALAARLRLFRNHGITTDHRQREQQGSFFYEQVELGFNYRLTDFQCALGIRQLGKARAWVERRRAIAARYDAAFAKMSGVSALGLRPSARHAYHLYVIQLELESIAVDRAAAFTALRNRGIGVNVHYVPVHLHPFYRTRFGTAPGLCPVTERAYERILSIPMFPGLTDEDVDYVVNEIERVVRGAA